MYDSSDQDLSVMLCCLQLSVKQRFCCGHVGDLLSSGGMFDVGLMTIPTVGHVDTNQSVARGCVKDFTFPRIRREPPNLGF
jgi:hypothetical protein